jgi:hypothetical protein
LTRGRRIRREGAAQHSKEEVERMKGLGVVVVGVGVALLAHGLAGREAAAAVLCQKKSGAVFLRDACKRKEAARQALRDRTPPTRTPSTSARTRTRTSSAPRWPSVPTTSRGSRFSRTATSASAPTRRRRHSRSQGRAARVSRTTGLVKGWARINADGTIARCYNCNLDVNETRRLFDGQYEVDFTPLGDDITGRPRVATLDTLAGGAATGFVSLANRAGDPSSVFVYTQDAAGADTDRAFVLMIF